MNSRRRGRYGKFQKPNPFPMSIYDNIACDPEVLTRWREKQS